MLKTILKLIVSLIVGIIAGLIIAAIIIVCFTDTTYSELPLDRYRPVGTIIPGSPGRIRKSIYP